MLQRNMPMGYRIVNGKVEIVPEATITVRQVFRAYLSGISTYRIAKELTAQGVLNASHKASWNHGSIEKILENPKYQRDEFLPPLIDRPTFEAVQERRREKCGQPYRRYVERCNQPGEKIN